MIVNKLKNVYNRARFDQKVTLVSFAESLTERVKINNIIMIYHNIENRIKSRYNSETVFVWIFQRKT